MTLEMPDIDLPKEDNTKKKKEAQHKAWKKWYDGPKGQAWRQKRLKRQPEPAK